MTIIKRKDCGVVSDYNQHMGGVDHADTLRQLHCVDQKSWKWWHRLFWGMCDNTFVNAFVVYKEIFDKDIVFLNSGDLYRKA
ncbi:hypothetical protein PR048_009229 [Dryococelus australis]|uniref:PiggyBac transposable element-derived protein domain-containing protein n=1 Tax=Dryococelus australis TaxID=614101 RepID=A0ABQ9HZC7_9NEOP|nr:hypothetical protein PR048_009229 [Dryococelus australis]